MHNCKTTKIDLIELALDEKQLEQNQGLRLELAQCAGCREEYASLRNALRIVDQTMQSASPPETFWSGYHARLRQRLELASDSIVPLHSAPRRKSPLASLQRLVTASVQLPVPIAAALVLLVALSFILVMKFGKPVNAQAVTGVPQVLVKTIEVPVIRDHVVTRVVYRERNSGTGTQSETRSVSNAARGRNEMKPQTPISLVGFKPANDVKLTIIKGDRHEK